MNPVLKKAIGIVLMLLGLLALVTPFTPGSWLIFVGLELLGIRMAYWVRIKPQISAWLKKNLGWTPWRQVE